MQTITNKQHALPPVLDVTCGSRMMWFNKKDDRAWFVDKREEQHTLCDGRELVIAPDQIADFTDLPFPDESFFLVVFDPPHLNSLGDNSWMAKKYGRLTGDWEIDIASGFLECFRVLKPNGTLIFKWNTTDINADDIIKLSPVNPLFGHTSGKMSKTIWITFIKPENYEPNRPIQQPLANKPFQTPKKM